MRVLIVEDGFARGALAAARALAANGHDVGVASPRRGMAAASRACKRWHRSVPPSGDSAGFVESLNRAILESGYSVMLPAGDVELFACSAMRDHIKAVIPVTSHAQLLRATDKETLTAAAIQVGLDVPRTEEATAQTIQSFDLPVVVKPTVQWKPGAPRDPKRLDVRVYTTYGDAEKRASELRRAGGIPLVQEYVEGALMSLCLVIGDDGRVVCSEQQEASRMWPPARGISTRAVTVPLDTELTDNVLDLLRQLDWRGLAQIQFIKGDRTWLIDLNARLYGSLSLAVTAGANLPLAWALLADDLSSRSNDPTKAKVGCRYQWLEGDLKRALRERNGGVTRDVAETLRYAMKSTHSILSLKDPLPAWVRIRDLQRETIHRTKR